MKYYTQYIQVNRASGHWEVCDFVHSIAERGKVIVSQDGGGDGRVRQLSEFDAIEECLNWSLRFPRDSYIPYDPEDGLTPTFPGFEIEIGGTLVFQFRFRRIDAAAAMS